VRRVSPFGLCSLGAPVLVGALAMPARAEPEPVKAAVVRSQGTQFLGMTIWRELNTGWADFGDLPVEIDYMTLAGYDLTLSQIEATEADVLILSNPAFLTYTAAEIASVQEYVEAGHGLIISYGKFRSADRALAPLVGLSQTVSLGTGTWPDPFGFDVLLPDHSVFARIGASYAPGVRVLASPTQGSEWPILDTATVLATAAPEFQQFKGDGVIVANETSASRGLYFAHYPEALSEGSNEHDMQVFYNGLLWTAGVPEPASAMSALVGVGFLSVRSRGERRRRYE